MPINIHGHLNTGMTKLFFHINRTGTVTQKEPFERQNGRLSYKYGYIDRSGAMVIQPREAESIKWLSYYAKVLAFSEGVAGVQQEDKMGYMDKAGRLVIPPRYR